MNGGAIKKITFEQLELCVNVDTYGSLEETARVLQLPRPLLEQKIAEVEAQTGITLFFRKGQGVRKATRAGRLLLREWREILQKYQDSLVRAAESQTCANTRVIIGIAEMANEENFLLPMVEVFQRRHPEAGLRVEAGSIQELELGLLTGTKDLILVNLYLESLFEDKGIRKKVLLHTPWCAGMLRTNPLAEKEALSWEDLKEQKFVLPNDPGLIRMVDRVSARHGFVPKVSLSSRYLLGKSLCARAEDEIFLVDRYMKDHGRSEYVYRPLPEIESGILMAMRAEESDQMVWQFWELAMQYYTKMESLGRYS